MVENEKTPKKITPYIPFKTFVGFVDRFKSTTTPTIIDSSLLMSMSGSMRGQLLSSIRYLNLIDSNNFVQPSFDSLVNAYKTEDWPKILKDIIFDGYSDVVKDLNINNGTLNQLSEMFRKRGNVDGQMLEKSIRFYLAALDECGIKYSPFFKARKPRKQTPRKRKTKNEKQFQNNGSELEDEIEEEEEISGTKRVKVNIDIPGKKSVSIYLPSDMDNEDWDMVKTMLEAYVKRLTNVGGDI